LQWLYVAIRLDLSKALGVNPRHIKLISLEQTQFADALADHDIVILQVLLSTPPNSALSLANVGDTLHKQAQTYALRAQKEMAATKNMSCLRMHKTCGNDRLALLQATEPELLATLDEIDRAKKALRGHPPAAGPSRSASSFSGVSRHMVLRSGSSSSERTVSDSPYSYDSTTHRCGELPRPRHQRTLSAGTRTLKPFKALNQTLCAQTPVPKSKLTDKQEKQQLFLKDRSARYNHAPPKSNDFLVSDYATTRTRKSCCTSLHFDNIEVSKHESRHDLKLWIFMVYTVLHIAWLLT